MGAVWVARTGAWEDKTQEAAALLARAFQDLQGPGGHETALTADTATLTLRLADSDIDGPNRLGSGNSRCAHFGLGTIQQMGLTSPEDL